MVSAEENTYFLRAFEALGVNEVRRAADLDMQATIGFKAIMREAADTRSYAAALSVLVVCKSAPKWDPIRISNKPLICGRSLPGGVGSRSAPIGAPPNRIFYVIYQRFMGNRRGVPGPVRC
jgi:hypothetical protein